MIINLDETNALLDNGKEKEFFQELIRILRNASASIFNLLTILSGTYSTDLFEQFQFGQYKFVDIGLSMIELEASKEVILGMTANPHLYHVSPHLEYILTLCGGVGRYLEIAIIQMSILGSAQMDGKVSKGFNLNAYEYFLTNLQTPQYIQTLLENLTNGVLSHYPKVFSRFAQSIPATLFSNGLFNGELSSISCLLVIWKKKGLYFSNQGRPIRNAYPSPSLRSTGQSSTAIKTYRYPF